jgi:hypothetical protein
MIHGYINVVGIGNVGLKGRLTSGDTVVFRVRSHTGQDTWLVSLLGKQVRVRSEIPLSTGDVLKARAHFERGQLFLKLLSHQRSTGAERFLQRQGMPVNSANLRIVDSFMQSGLPLREELVSYAVKLLKTLSQRERRGVSRFLAVMIDKGIRPSPEEAENIFSSVVESGGTGGESSGRRKSRHRDRSDSNEQNGGEGSEPDGEEGGAVAPEAGDIRAQCFRTSENGENRLQLWNHSAGARDNWIVIPVAWEHAGERLEGRLRLRLRKGTADRFTFSVYARQRWHFSADLSGEHRTLTLYTDSDNGVGQGERIVELLKENLHNEEFEIDDTIKREEEFDLFDPGTRAEWRGIDRVV